MKKVILIFIAAILFLLSSCSALSETMESSKSVDILEFTVEDEEITMKSATVEIRNGIKFLDLTVHNSGEDKYWGYAYKLEKEKEGDWKPVERSDGRDYSFPLVANYMYGNSDTVMDLCLDNYIADASVPPGKYRIKLEFTRNVTEEGGEEKTELIGTVIVFSVE